jgi:hypothetical protein
MHRLLAQLVYVREHETLNTSVEGHAMIASPTRMCA